MKPMRDAEYEQVVEINLAEVRPTVAFPHLPGNAKTIDEIELWSQSRSIRLLLDPVRMDVWKT